MFSKARIKLTFWYLLIIMLVSTLFSVAIYKGFTLEFERFERLQRSRIENSLPLRDFRSSHLSPDPELIEQAKERARNTLILINVGILILAGGAGYFLSGRTLKPIEAMVDEQNRFVADASHELKTPLTALKSEIEVNIRDKNLKLTDAKKLLESNLEEVDRLSQLTEKMIDLARYQNNSNLIFEELTLSKVSNEALKLVEPLIKKKQIKLKVNVKNITFVGNFDRLVQLLVILLDNAIKYSPTKSKVSLTMVQTDHQIKIEIEDCGIGIDNKDIPYLFDRFFRADKSRSKEVSGFGLGLSIAKNIVNMHNGEVVVKSELGKGTNITILLPVKQKDPLSLFSVLKGKLFNR